MIAEPKSLGESMREHVEQIAARHGVTVTATADYDDEDLAEARSHGLEQMREVAWRRVIPAQYHGTSMQQFAAPIRKELEAWAERPAGRNLVLLGPIGVGKSAAACAACRPAHFAGLEVMFAPVVEMLDQLRPSGADASLDTFTGVDRLILDDVGSERPTDWTAERLFALVNRRWLDRMPTVVTSNLEPADLEAAVGGRMFSRLVGNDAVVLRLAGPDRRRKKR